MQDNPRIVIFGSGVIGSTVGGWVAGHYDNIWFYDKPEVLDHLEKNGLTLYEGGQASSRTQVKVNVMRDLKDAADADLIVVGVKNYSLDGVAGYIKDTLGDKLILAMQNGLENQQILPRYFSKVIYCVVSYNAWMDEPGVFGYQKRGPLEWGTLDNSLQEEQKTLAAIFNKGLPIDLVDRISDAAHCKLVLNLTNSTTTLIGLGQQAVSDMGVFQTLLSNQLYEGLQVLKAAGVREVKLGGMPPWLLITAGAKLPRMISGPLFKKNVKKMVISSMAQDVIQNRGQGATELESINGYLLELAKKVGHPAPWNQAIYDLCKEEFGKEKFVPMDVKEVWELVRPKLQAAGVRA